jgi:predicted MFS family arabinose efflux permease
LPGHELQAAMALNGIANNGSRIAGPLAAGAVIASAGAQYVFALNAALSLVAVAMLSRWTQAPRSSALPSERFVGAMRVGLQHVRQSPGFQRVLVRSAAFFLQSIAVIALLPLAARQIAGGGAGTFTLLLAGMGAGAVAGAFLLPRVTRATTPNRRVVGGTLAYGAATAAVALAPNLYVALPAMFAAGLAYMVAANTLMVAAQTALPDWVRARGLSIYQMVMMGANALGAACWGQVASQSSVTASLVVAALAGAVMLLLLRNVEVGLASADDLVPARLWKMPELAVPVEADQGPVLVTVEYRIDPARAAEFLDVMRESRRVWLSHGLLAWSLFGDLSEKGRYIEHMLDESWASYVLRNERVASSYLPLRDRKHAFHVGPQPPAVTRYLGQTPSR